MGQGRTSLSGLAQRAWRIAGAVSLRTKIVGIPAVLVVFLGSVVALDVWVSEGRTLRRELDRRATELAASLASQAAELVLTGDLFGLHELVEEVLRSTPDARYVVVLDPSRAVLVHTFPSRVPAGLLEVNTSLPRSEPRVVVFYSEEGPIHDVAYPIFQGRAGEVRLGLTEAGVRRVLSRDARRIAGITGGVFLLALVVAFALATVINRPVTQLVAQTERVAAGDFTARAQVWADDEIGRLSRAFNEMVSSLEVSRQDLLRRQRELSALSGIAVAAGTSADLYGLLRIAAERTALAAGANAAWVLLGERREGMTLAAAYGLPGVEGGLPQPVSVFCPCTGVLEGEEPRLLPLARVRCGPLTEEMLASAGLSCHVGLPLRSKSGVLGLLVVAYSDKQVLEDFERDVLEAVARTLGAAVENARLWAEVTRKEESRRFLLGKLVSAQEEERKRVARELHDEAGQLLTTLLLGLEGVAAEADLGRARARARELISVARQTLDAVRNLAWQLRPAALDDLGLVPAVRQYVASFSQGTGIAVDLEILGLEEERLEREVEIVVYRVLQEALTNVARHSGSARASVLLERTGQRLVLVVEDDGKGFDQEALVRRSPPPLGLFGMQERAEAVGGRLAIESAPGAGTTVQLEVPLPSGVGA